MSATLSPYGLSPAECATLEAFDRAVARLSLAVGPYAIAKAQAGVRGAYGRVEVLGLCEVLTPTDHQIARDCIT